MNCPQDLTGGPLSASMTGIPNTPRSCRYRTPPSGRISRRSAGARAKTGAPMDASPRRYAENSFARRWSQNLSNTTYSTTTETTTRSTITWTSTGLVKKSRHTPNREAMQDHWATTSGGMSPDENGTRSASTANRKGGYASQSDRTVRRFAIANRSQTDRKTSPVTAPVTEGSDRGQNLTTRGRLLIMALRSVTRVGEPVDNSWTTRAFAYRHDMMNTIPAGIR